MSFKLGLNIYAHQVSDEFNYGTNQTRGLELFVLEFRKIAESDFG